MGQVSGREMAPNETDVWPMTEKGKSSDRDVRIFIFEAKSYSDGSGNLGIMDVLRLDWSSERLRGMMETA